MKLSKIIPQRKLTVKFTYVGRNFTTMNSVWRKARGKLKNPMDKCWWCKVPINDGEPIAVAMRDGKRNVVLCDKCASEALREDND
jgi:hypothetical protein